MFFFYSFYVTFYKCMWKNSNIVYAKKKKKNLSQIRSKKKKSIKKNLKLTCK